MEQLITMHRRIKAVETIKKITHAMRLISMSTHSKLKNKIESLKKYKQLFEKLYIRIYSSLKLVEKDKNNFQNYKKNKNLIILVGSQKGLCGTFNSSLFKFFELEYSSNETDELITVGKNATDYLKSKNKRISTTYNNFSSTNFIHISHSLTNFIRKNENLFNSIIIFSNIAKSFFIQQPTKTVINLNEEPKLITEENNQQKLDVPYIIEQSWNEVHSIIEHLKISISIQELLFQSLVAEQSARFLSMDTATENANKLITTMKLEYNKLRQAAITRELTELTSSY